MLCVCCPDMFRVTFVPPQKGGAVGTEPEREQSRMFVNGLQADSH